MEVSLVQSLVQGVFHAWLETGGTRSSYAATANPGYVASGWQSIGRDCRNLSLFHAAEARSRKPNLEVWESLAGNKAYKSGNSEQALKFYEQAHEIQPHAFTHANAALVYISRRDWHSAAAEAAKATEVDPGYGRAWHRLVKAHLNVRNFPRALAAIKSALGALRPEDKEVPRLRAVEGLLQVGYEMHGCSQIRFLWILQCHNVPQSTPKLLAPGHMHLTNLEHQTREE